MLTNIEHWSLNVHQKRTLESKCSPTSNIGVSMFTKNEHWSLNAHQHRTLETLESKCSPTSNIGVQHPKSSRDAADLLSDAHWNPVQRSDVYSTEASTSEYAQKMSLIRIMNRIELQRSHVQHTIAAYGGRRLAQHGRNTTSTDECAVHDRQKKDIFLLNPA